MRGMCRFLGPVVSCLVIVSALSRAGDASAQGEGPKPEGRTVTGFVQNQDLRRVSQAVVQVRDEEGITVAETVTDRRKSVV